jgi:GT2 family glycosyltransferase
LHTVTIVIPHWNGEGILRRCLVSVRKTRGVRPDVVVVDNGSTDGSARMLGREFPEVRIVHSPVNLGFAGGCNLGIRSAGSAYVALLNNDAVVTPGWLEAPVRALEDDPQLAAVQPKMLSLSDPGRFDYAGGAGGEMDLFGFPFAAGRLFDAIETDHGQYDAARPCFWASGAAVVFRRSALRVSGLLDESFFAHMEEIDLEWRLHRAGYRVAVEPRAVVFHQSGGTLGGERFRKMVLNHRNSLAMLVKNLPGPALAWVVPARLALDGAAFTAALLTGRWKRAAAIPAALAGLAGMLPHVWRERRRSMPLDRTPESAMLHRLYRGSIVFEHFLCGTQEFGRLRNRGPLAPHPESTDGIPC